MAKGKLTIPPLGVEAIGRHEIDDRRAGVDGPDELPEPSLAWMARMRGCIFYHQILSPASGNSRDVLIRGNITTEEETHARRTVCFGQTRQPESHVWWCWC